MKILSFLVIILSCTLVAHGQKKPNLTEASQNAEYFFAREDYKEAVYHYLIIHEHGKPTANIHYKIGFCYLNIPGQEPRAIPFFEEAIKNMNPKYKEKSIAEKQAPLHALYYLGNVYRINNELGKALDVYNRFLNDPAFEGKYNLRIVQEEIKAVERAKVIQDRPTKIEIHAIGPPVNTSAAEFNPVVSGDESIMVFARSLRFYNAVFFTRIEDGKWIEPININPQIISDGDFYPTSLSWDGTELYLVKKHSVNSDIYVSYFKNNRWTQAKKLNENINSKRQETHASISPDGSTLYFTSNRKGGIGKMDIYKSTRSNGEWGKAENLGKSINTSENEETPFITNKGKTLFFSSQGHYVMGGFDVFLSNLTGENTWTTPLNAGFPINTTGDDLFFFPVESGKAGYQARKGGEGFDAEDIFRITILDEIKGYED
jgi:tetratricopeptide (TPR) repeat protein